jgi:hypothetical protein
VSDPREPKAVDDPPSPNGEILHGLILGGLILLVLIIMTFEIRLLETVLTN